MSERSTARQLLVLAVLLAAPAPASANTISGTVGPDPDVNRFCVRAYDATLSQQVPVPGMEATTDFAGGYTLTEPPGPPPARLYKVEFQHCPLSGNPEHKAYVRQFYNAAPTFESATVIDLNTDNATANATLQSGQWIGGTITDDQMPPAPLTGICVTVWDAPPGTGPAIGGGGTGGSGEFITEPVPSGDYKLQFVDCTPSANDYLSEWWEDASSFDNADLVTVAASDVALPRDVKLTLDSHTPPTLDPIGSKTVAEGQQLLFTISATDPDGQTLAYSGSNLPAGATFNAATRAFSWTPGVGQAGSYPNVQFDVSDGALTDSEVITITVNPGLQPAALVPTQSDNRATRHSAQAVQEEGGQEAQEVHQEGEEAAHLS